MFIVSYDCLCALGTKMSYIQRIKQALKATIARANYSTKAALMLGSRRIVKMLTAAA